MIRSPVVRAVLLCLAVAATVAACGMVRTVTPEPTPADFGGIATELGKRQITVGSVVSGDPGCADSQLAPTAIRLTLSGLDQPTAVTTYLYIFGSGDSYTKLRAAVDRCAASYATDRASFVFVDAPPFVLAAQGPLGTQFVAAVHDALSTAAGNGG